MPQADRALVVLSVRLFFGRVKRSRARLLLRVPVLSESSRPVPDLVLDRAALPVWATGTSAKSPPRQLRARAAQPMHSFTPCRLPWLSFPNSLPFLPVPSLRGIRWGPSSPTPIGIRAPNMPTQSFT